MPIARVIWSEVLVSGRNTPDIAIRKYAPRVTITHIREADAFCASPIASQFFICRKAPNAGLKARLQSAVAVGFPRAGAASTPRSRFARGGAYRFSLIYPLSC